MSEEMTDHVLSAIVDQIPKEHLADAHTLIEQRLGWKSVYIASYDDSSFTREIADRVESTLEEIGQWSKENQNYWEIACINEWRKRLADPKADIYDYGCVLGDYTLSEIQETIRDSFVESDDVHDLMRDTILKHYGVQQ